MALDLFGPTQGAGGVTVRPTDTRSFTASDTFFRDCSSPDLDDGTEFQSAWFNEILAALRGLARGNGQTAGAVDVVTQDNADDNILLKTVQHLMQRGQPLYGEDTSSTVNVMTAALSPAAPEYKKGMRVAIKANTTNTGGPCSLSLNGLGPKQIVRADGVTPPFDSEIIQNGIRDYVFDGTNWQMPTATSRPVLARAIDIYVNFATGNDNNSGSLASPLKTIQGAFNLAYQYGPSPYAVTAHVADGTYPPAATPSRPGPQVNIIGNIVTPTSVVVDGGATNCIVVNGPNTVDVQGVTVTHVASGSLHIGFLANGSGASIHTHNTASLGIAGGYAIGASFGGTAWVDGNHTFYGGGVGLITAGADSVTSIAGGVTLTIANAISVSGSTVVAQGGSIVYFNGSPMPVWQNPGNVTGRRFDVDTNSVIETQGGGINYIPGTIAGVQPTGGQYE